MKVYYIYFGNNKFAEVSVYDEFAVINRLHAQIHFYNRMEYPFNEFIEIDKNIEDNLLNKFKSIAKDNDIKEISIREVELKEHSKPKIGLKL